MKRAVLSCLPASQSKTNLKQLQSDIQYYYSDLNLSFSKDRFLNSINQLKEEQAVCLFGRDIVATRYGFSLYNISVID